MGADFKCPLSAEELQKIKEKRKTAVWNWVMDRYPKLRLEELERNLTLFEEIKKYDDNCPTCMSTQSCPTLDGNRMQGRLMPDGVLQVWMEPCPNGHKPLKAQTHEQKNDDWRKRRNEG